MVVYGNTQGIKKKSVTGLEKIYRRKVPPDRIISQELARYLTELSSEINRQLGVLITRGGTVSHVIVGDAGSIFLPELSAYPLGKKYLRGLRFVHTHLKNEPLTHDDLTDLALLRFDYIAAIGIRDALPDRFYTAHLTANIGDKPYEINPAVNFYNDTIDFLAHIGAIEEEMGRQRPQAADSAAEKAIIIAVSQAPKHEIEEALDELQELCASSGIATVDRVIQRPKEINPRYLLGAGRLRDLIIDALAKGATLLVFNENLTPSQSLAIAELTEIKVIDRTALILDIFARRAMSRDGKVQVELAQLKYRLPRLTGKGTAMSRLTGGIGGRGPGEMKLEIDRRRVRDRINILEKELEKLSMARKQRRARRSNSTLPIVSIVGYTNAGKSTLLNNLTESAAFVEDKMFATLDTSTRRLRFPEERDVIITDTVGFIKDLPRDLITAFKATLEELEDADTLIHLVDASNQRFEQHIQSVETILKDLGIDSKPTLLVFNKTDKIHEDELEGILRRYGAVGISAINPSTFGALLETLKERVFGRRHHQEAEGTDEV
ncbi:GTPase HflX [Candidatus Magnetominusculus xianensis]|uniref:GTPase HflX n=1 Tax=Candidatus Magnetominusculus xianensis TaxID=1748249 RepID=A0ABR5SEK1_9BACT|nr:GTPase HflX [Candidatus Magnetominusculus xianensis]KWT82591.1 GTP-binding protein HflX [Candidatus Magnetominusculus xianensis]MBF0405167.1 GTPase HflX [Nitrospirota bacterium]